MIEPDRRAGRSAAGSVSRTSGIPPGSGAGSVRRRGTARRRAAARRWAGSTSTRSSSRRPAHARSASIVERRCASGLRVRAGGAQRRRRLQLPSRLPGAGAAPARRRSSPSPLRRRLLALEGVGNPDNVGGLFRVGGRASASDGVLLDPRSGDPLYRKAIRTSMGAALTLPWRASRLAGLNWAGSARADSGSWR